MSRRGTAQRSWKHQDSPVRVISPGHGGAKYTAEPASHDDDGGGATPPCLSPHYGTGSYAESDRAGLADTSQPWLQAALGYTTSSAAVPRDDGGRKMAGIRPGLPPFLESDLDLWGCQLLDGISPVHRT